MARLPGRRALLALLVAAAGLPPLAAHAYPELHAFIREHSGRSIDCAFCHVSPDGPNGNGPGQIGSLAPDGLRRLQAARRAIAPGARVDSPILNPFGNHLVEVLGGHELQILRKHPEALPGALEGTSDLDGDGISDRQEVLDGTLPLDPAQGSPPRLLVIGLRRQAVHIVLLLLATLLGLYGLNHLLRWFDLQARAALARRRAERDRQGTGGTEAGGDRPGTPSGRGPGLR